MASAIIFDLDNTLYNEFDYVRSGFEVVSRYLSQKYNVDHDLIFQQCLKDVALNGRGKVFDRVLDFFGIQSSEILVQLLVVLYRNHKPDVSLKNEVKDFLKDLKQQGYKLGLITDGDSSLQLKKIESLKLGSYFDFILHTDILGKGFEKPSPVPFLLTLKYLDVRAEDSIYVGDRFIKDYQGARAVGMKSILYTEYFRDPEVKEDCLHSCDLESLSDLIKSI
ncbi:MAG: HAD-IA family hydrolase [Bacteriovoracaceae bacterium]